jgi:hypothetical protein
MYGILWKEDLKRKTEESLLLEAVTREWLMTSQQA